MPDQDFNRVIDRHGSNSYKWDTTPEGVTAMWVADMDFRTAPCIVEALERRVAHGVFGYTAVPGSYYEAVDRWFGGRHGWHIDRGSVIYTTGVVPAISAIIKAVCRPGESVIVQTPAYNCFFSSIRNNGCLLADNRLLYNKADGSYSIDFEGLERLARRTGVTCLLLCNPHNPSGRVWTPGELRRIGDICLANGVFVISDEIHCELVYGGREYTPYATLGEEYARASASCVSPSKAFNIAGLQIANIVAADPARRAAIDKAININEVCDVNPFGVAATEAAYNRGGEWLDRLTGYLHDNYRLVRGFFAEYLPQYRVTPLEATYLAWINVECTGLPGDQIAEILTEKAAVRLNGGAMYGPGGENFVRLNFACARSVLRSALDRVAPVLADLAKY